MSIRKMIFVLSTVLMTFGASMAMANEGAATGNPYGSLSAALAISVAAFGGALAQGRTASSALEGIARNPGARKDIFVPMIIGLALIESLVLYAFVIALIKT
jgi:F-type H+-transporting ATPase subunit c